MQVRLEIEVLVEGPEELQEWERTVEMASPPAPGTSVQVADPMVEAVEVTLVIYSGDLTSATVWLRTLDSDESSLSPEEFSASLRSDGWQPVNR